MKMLSNLKVFPLSILLLFVTLAGCNSSDDDNSSQIKISGVVQTGCGSLLPESNHLSQVELYKSTGGNAKLVGSSPASSDGKFSIEFEDDENTGIYFLKARLDNQIDLMTVLGVDMPSNVVINELTTVAAAYSYARFFDFQTDLIAGSGDLLPLQIAAGMNANLVDTQSGCPSTVMLNTPNADQTNSLRSLRSLANLASYCVADATVCVPQLQNYVSSGSNQQPTGLLDSLVLLARNPAGDVSGIYELSRKRDVYEPDLENMPDAWTLAVKVNDTGSPQLTFGGVANTVFDERGYAWINNNVVQGDTVSSNFIVVLKPDGSPSDGKNGTPLSPVTGGGILGAGLGITYNKVSDTIWVGDFGWGGVNPIDAGNGSVSEIALDGSPVSPDSAYDGGTNRVQGIVVDNQGNVWSANYGNNKVIVFPDGDPKQAVEIGLDCQPFGLAHNPQDDTVWATTVGCQEGVADSVVAHYSLQQDGVIEQLSLTKVGDVLKGVDVDFDGSVWVASGNDSSVYHLSADGDVLDRITGVTGLASPWNVRLDDAGNVWVANFGSMNPYDPDNVYLDAAVSVLAGAQSQSGKPAGTPLSPSTGYTLPSAGEEVLLFDGTPLSETGEGQPKLTPLMRSVSAVPDRAGNLWVSNNWKPNFNTDITHNPGGDGMVIFIGLAEPTNPGRTQ